MLWIRWLTIAFSLAAIAASIWSVLMTMRLMETIALIR